MKKYPHKNLLERFATTFRLAGPFVLEDDLVVSTGVPMEGEEILFTREDGGIFYAGNYELGTVETSVDSVELWIGSGRAPGMEAWGPTFTWPDGLWAGAVQTRKGKL